MRSVHDDRACVMTRRELNEARWGTRMVARDRVKVTVARHPVHVVRAL